MFAKFLGENILKILTSVPNVDRITKNNVITDYNIDKVICGPAPQTLGDINS
jgi:hypothetical protein